MYRIMKRQDTIGLKQSSDATISLTVTLEAQIGRSNLTVAF